MFAGQGLIKGKGESHKVGEKFRFEDKVGLIGLCSTGQCIIATIIHSLAFLMNDSLNWKAFNNIFHLQGSN